MFVRIAPAALALAATLAAAGANAAPLSVWGDDGRINAYVKYSNADVTTAQGARKLAFRIRVAAFQVCGGDDPVLRSRWHFQACRDGAIDRALSVLNAPLVADALGRAPVAYATAHR